MKHFKRIFCFALLAAIAATVLAGCASTGNPHGVQIQKNRSLNPLDYIPAMPSLF